MFESQLKISLNEPFPKNSSLADIMEKAPKMFVMPLVEIYKKNIYIYIYCGRKGSRKPPISSTYDFLFFRGILVHIFNKKIFYDKNYLKFIF